MKASAEAPGVPSGATSMASTRSASVRRGAARAHRARLPARARRPGAARGDPHRSPPRATAPGANRPEFADVAEEWFERGRFERDWSASTQVDYRSVLDAHLLPEFGARRIEAISPQRIERWRSALADDARRSRRTVNKILARLHASFSTPSSTTTS